MLAALFVVKSTNKEFCNKFFNILIAKPEKKAYNNFMEGAITEASYPLTFRQEEAKKLGEYLRMRQCVNLLGMRRVGISNFLRFFLYHDEIAKTYIGTDQQHLFIPVDLNDLVEREIYPFWTLTLKRIVDACEASTLPEETKKKVSGMFLNTIQSQDLFLAIDNIRSVLGILVEKNVMPTIFLIRFDRLKDAFNPSFFDNLAGLRDATHELLVYVFTSDRSLDEMFPSAKIALSVFTQNMYIRPAKKVDMQVIYESYRKRYNFTLEPEVEEALFNLVYGNIQYLQLSLIALNEKKVTIPHTQAELLQFLISDERIVLQSEELWESLSRDERKILQLVVKGQVLSEADRQKAQYLFDSGYIMANQGGLMLFSPLFANYVMQTEQAESAVGPEAVHLTRKENLLFTLLYSQPGEICEREKIIEAVWPEYKEFGVSDWAIDRLVARVRVKLRQQNSPFEIVTVRTRGYKLSNIKG